LNNLRANVYLENGSLKYLQEKSSSPFKESSLSVLDPILDPKKFWKILKINDDFYELNSFTISKENKNYLVIKLQKENSNSEVYSFEGTFDQIISYDSEWKVFKSLEQIFDKIIKIKLGEGKFKITFEERELILQFVVDIIGDSTTLKIKLFKDFKDSTDHQTDLTPDSKILNEDISIIKAKLEYLEKQFFSREHQIFSFIAKLERDNNRNYSTNYLKDGDSFEFAFDVSKSGEIKIAYELDCSTANIHNQPLYLSILLEFTSKTDPKEIKEFVLHNQLYLFLTSVSSNIPEGSVLSIKNSRNIDLLKGSYSTSVKFLGGVHRGNGFYTSECGRLILKRINL